MAKLKEYKTSDGVGTMLCFSCPGCGYSHPYSLGIPGYPSWEWNGSMDKPTFTPSLLCFKDTPSRRCHCYVKDGQIQFLDDCHHALAGRTVEIPDWEDD